MLDADIDLGALLDGAEAGQPALESASRAVALIEADGTVGTLDESTLQPDNGAGGRT